VRDRGRDGERECDPVADLVRVGHAPRAAGAARPCERDDAGRAGFGQVLAPLLAGVLVTLIGIAGVTAIDVVTFLVSIATLLAATIPRAPVRDEARRGYVRDLATGWRFVLARSGLLALLVMFAAVNSAWSWPRSRSRRSSVLHDPRRWERSWPSEAWG
jgi:hypothetical protein